MHVRPQRCQEVVGVHDDVDGGVDEGGLHGDPAGHEGDPDPPQAEHGGVVVDVQEGELEHVH